MGMNPVLYFFFFLSCEMSCWVWSSLYGIPWCIRQSIRTQVVCSQKYCKQRRQSITRTTAYSSEDNCSPSIREGVQYSRWLNYPSSPPNGVIREASTDFCYCQLEHWVVLVTRSQLVVRGPCCWTQTQPPFLLPCLCPRAYWPSTWAFGERNWQTGFLFYLIIEGFVCSRYLCGHRHN